MRVAILLVAAVVIVACGDSDGGSNNDDGAVTLPGDPADAVIQLLEYTRNDQRTRQWSILHPAHQEIATRTAYIQCPRDELVGSTEVIEVFDETVPVPRLGEVSTTAVTIETSTEIAGDEVSTRHTLHLIDLDGDWRWVLNEEALDAFDAGDCP